MPNNQAKQTLQAMRNIVKNLRQAGQNNASMAGQLSKVESYNRSALTSNNTSGLQGLAQREGQASSAMSGVANAENSAVKQLDQLEQMIAQLETQL